jgi:hypothetical protein
MTDAVRTGIGLALIGLALLLVGQVGDFQILTGVGVIALAAGLIGLAVVMARGES